MMESTGRCRTKHGSSWKNMILVGNEQDTIYALVYFIQTKTKYTSYMEILLSLININGHHNCQVISTFRQNSHFLCRIFDASLSYCDIGFQYMLSSCGYNMSVYIGDTKCLGCHMYILINHSLGYEYSSMEPSRLITFSIFLNMCIW